MREDSAGFTRELLATLLIERVKQGHTPSERDMLVYGTLAHKCWKIAYQKPGETELELHNTPLKVSVHGPGGILL